MPLLLKIALLSVLLPASVAILFVIAARRLWPAGSPKTVPPWVIAAGLALGYLSSHYAVVGFPRIPPTESTQWLFLFVAIGALLGCLYPLWRQRDVLHWGIPALLAGSFLGLTLRPLLQHRWDLAAASAWLLVLGAGLLALWRSLQQLDTRVERSALWLSLLITAAGTSAVLMLTGSALLGQLGLAVTAVFGAMALVSLTFPQMALNGSSATVNLILVPGLLLNGYFYSETPAAAVLCLALSLFAPWVCATPLGKEHSVRRHVLLACTTTLLATLPALIMAWRFFQATPDYF